MWGKLKQKRYWIPGSILLVLVVVLAGAIIFKPFFKEDSLAKNFRSPDSMVAKAVYTVTVVPASTINDMVSGSTPVPQYSDNISQGKQVKASTYQLGNEATKANDGELSTRWAASSSSYPQWWRVDLGSDHSLTKADIYWYSAANRSYKYQVQTSSDDINWKTIIDRSARTSTGDTSDTLTGSARYVRVYITKSNAGWASFFEVIIHGTPTGPTTTADSQGLPATSSSYQTGNETSKGNDGNVNTRWAASSSSYPQWWRVDFGSSKNLTKAEIVWYESAVRAYKYQLQTSNDATSWTTGINKSTNTAVGDTSDTLPAGSSGRYFRVYVTGSNSGWASAYEFKVYTNTETPPTAPTATFSTNPTTIVQGGSSTLSWSTTNATEVTLDGISVATSGTKSVSPTSTTTYTLNAKGSGGEVTRVATVTVTPPLVVPTISSFTASPTSIESGGSSKLSWDITGATSASINQNIGTVSATVGTLSVSPSITTAYTLTAVGPGGSKTATVVVTVGTQPPGSPFSFAVFGDNRPDTSTTNFTMPLSFQKIIASLVTYAPRPNFAISIGDYTYLSSSDSETTMRSRYNAFMTELNKLTAVVKPAYLAVGNHEIIENATASKVYKEYFADTVLYGKSSSLYYSFDQGDTHFIVLNTGSGGKIDYYGEDSASNSAQGKWLVSDLRANTKPWVIVSMHYPLFDSKTSKPYGTSPYAERTALSNLFDKYGVDLVQQGDVHYYRRHTEANGITYLTQGQAGASPKTSTGSDYNIACHTGDICYGTNNSTGAGYTIMNNDGTGKLTGTSYQVNLSSGGATVLDTFTVNQIASKYIPAMVAKDVPIDNNVTFIESLWDDVSSALTGFFEKLFSLF